MPNNDPMRLAHLLYPPKVVKLLKHELGIDKSFSRFSSRSRNVTRLFPMDSDRALVVSHFELAIGIATGQPASQIGCSSNRGLSSYHPDSSRGNVDKRKVDMHNNYPTSALRAWSPKAATGTAEKTPHLATCTGSSSDGS